jgi:nicotinamidase-related amidase
MNHETKTFIQELEINSELQFTLFLLIYYLASPFNQSYLGLTNMKRIKSLAHELMENREELEKSKLIHPRIQKFYHYCDTYKNTPFIQTKNSSMPFRENLLYDENFDSTNDSKKISQELIRGFDDTIPELKPKRVGERDSAFLLVIDPQQAFFGENINEKDMQLYNREIVIESIVTLIKLFRANNLHTNITSHLCKSSKPGGFLSLEDSGRNLHPVIVELLNDPINSGMVNEIPKSNFSAWREPMIQRALELFYPKYVVLAGGSTETCILQTANDLSNCDFEVLTVADCVASYTLSMNLQILKLLNSQYNHRLVSLDQIRKSLLSNS